MMGYEVTRILKSYMVNGVSAADSCSACDASFITS
jgi:hypothetical protein